MPLTKKQRLILEAILFLIRKGDLPTVREVGALVGLRSPATVLKHLRALEAQKLITLSGKSRGIRIADRELLQQIVDDSWAGSATSNESLDSPERDSEEDHEALTPADKLARADKTRPRDEEEHVRSVILQSHFPAFTGKHVKKGVRIVGAVAAGRPFESPEDRFHAEPSVLAIDPRLFASSGELVALQVEGDSMVDAGVLDGDYVIIRRQSSVEEGEIAAVLVDGEGTLKRWHHIARSSPSHSRQHEEERSDPTGLTSDRAREGMKETESPAGAKAAEEKVRLVAANERFAPIEISEHQGKEVIVFGKYVGLVRGELQIFE